MLTTFFERYFFLRPFPFKILLRLKSLKVVYEGGEHMRVKAFHARVQLRHPAVWDRPHGDVFQLFQIDGLRSCCTFCTGKVSEE